jgi:hypothetical protein
MSQTEVHFGKLRKVDFEGLDLTVHGYLMEMLYGME